MRVYLCTKLQVSRMILTIFRQVGGILLTLPPIAKRPPKKPTQIRVMQSDFKDNSSMSEIFKDANLKFRVF